jgi:hypothetical protein
MASFDHRLSLSVEPGRLAVCRLNASEAMPAWALGSTLTSITRTSDELSIVCDEARVPAGTTSIGGLVALRVDGTLEPDLIGVLASLANPLADAGVPILAIGTHDTDYVLVRSDDLDRALEALRRAGHSVRGR